MDGSQDDLLERSQHLSALGESLAAVIRTGHGRLVFVSGEAGVGKTALLGWFRDKHSKSARILWGACDGLFTPRPLGPLLDFVKNTRGELPGLIEHGARPYEVAEALLHELRVEAPTILVLEDVHWADEATLDVLRLLGRRLEAVPALILASYRDDELDRAHPLRIVLGELATEQAVERLEIESLSRAAVGKLAEPHGVDVDELYRKTAGNPFFVKAVLAAGKEAVPHTVRDAVLARSARLSSAARDILEAVAVIPTEVDLWLVQILAGEAIDSLDECLSSGVLTSRPRGVAFRHELARLAVEESIGPNRRVELHRRATVALTAPPTGPPDPARIAHHAEAAGDSRAVLRYAPEAATQAASLGAHREAAAQYARALRFGDGLSDRERAELLTNHSYQCHLTDELDATMESLERALQCYRRLGDRRGEASSLRSLSHTLWCPGRVTEAEKAGREAVALLEMMPPQRDLAMAYGNLSFICMEADKTEEALAYGTRALELAQRLDDTEIFVQALTTIGLTELIAGAPEGRQKLERSLELAEKSGLEERVAEALLCLASAAVRQRSYPAANAYVAKGVAYCSEHGLELQRLYALAYRARSELDQGRWTESSESAALVLRVPSISTTPRILALVVVGLLRARRGDPGPWGPLDEALALAEPSGELKRIAPVAAARAEVAWLEGDHKAVAEATEAAFDLAVSRRAVRAIGELAYWRWRAGIREQVPPGGAKPFDLQIAGDWEGAAEYWAGIGCPYEAALARGDADDDGQLRRALDELQRLGARPAAAIVARRLRERGASGLPRGPRLATQRNPASLTGREVEVLALVAQGLRNADVAGRLFIAEKTVDHHVSAILRKLGLRTRRQASAEALRLGLVRQDR